MKKGDKFFIPIIAKYVVIASKVSKTCGNVICIVLNEQGQETKRKMIVNKNKLIRIYDAAT